MMLKLADLEAVICLNGRLPSKEFFSKILNHSINIVAADGGAYRLLDMKIRPDFIVGDMDSLGENTGVCETKIHKNSDQNSTDFEKSLFFLRNKGITKILVLGMNGGEIDHIINNTNTFLRYSDQFGMYFYDEPEFGEAKVGHAVKGKMELKAEEGSNISLFSFDEGKIKTEGMKWEIKDKPFHVMKSSAARNKSKSKNISISTTGKSLLAIYSSKV